MGGKNRIDNFELNSVLLFNYLNTININKRKKVENFISDYLLVMKELVRILKKDKYLVMTVGNRRVDNKVVPLSDITREYLEKNGFNLEVSITRNIPQKRMPRKVSRVENCSVESMNQEYVLIFKKRRG